jgi:hypothetical protein
MLHRRNTIGLMLIAIASLLVVSPSAVAGKKLNGVWQLFITIPDGPGSSTERTLAVTMNASARDGLHGRLTITDDQGRTVPGVWRQNSKKISIAFESPCSPGEHCGSFILLGKMKNGTRFKKGDVIVMWDTPNDANHAKFDTSNGSFTGDRTQ